MKGKETPPVRELRRMSERGGIQGNKREDGGTSDGEGPRRTEAVGRNSAILGGRDGDINAEIGGSDVAHGRGRLRGGP